MHGRYGEGRGSSGHQGDGGGDDERRRTWVNVAGFAFVILLLVGGVWFAKVLAQHARIEDCLMSGRTNCAPIDTQH